MGVDPSEISFLHGGKCFKMHALQRVFGYKVEKSRKKNMP